MKNYAIRMKDYTVQMKKKNPIKMRGGDTIKIENIQYK